MLPPGGRREPCPGHMLEGPSSPIMGWLLRGICGEKRELWQLVVQTEILEEHGAAVLGGQHRLRPGPR